MLTILTNKKFSIKMTFQFFAITLAPFQFAAVCACSSVNTQTATINRHLHIQVSSVADNVRFE